MPRRSSADLCAVDSLAAAQHCCITLSQLTEAGLGPSAVAHRTRVAGGSWTRPLPGVVLVHRGTPTFEERAHAALLYAGPGAVLTAAAALVLHGVRGVDRPEVVDVLVDQSARPRSTRFVAVERTSRPATAVEVRGFACAPLPRALVAAARRLTALDEVRALVAVVVQSGRCSEDALLDELRLAQRCGTARLREVTREVVAGTRSVEEAKLRRLLLQADVPEPLWNVDLRTPDGRFVARPDGWWPEHGVAVEVNSRAWHLDPASWEATQARWARMSALGVVLVPVTPMRQRHEPEAVLREIVGALARTRGRRLPDLCVTRRT